VLQFGVGFAVLQRFGPLGGLAGLRPARGRGLAAVAGPEPAPFSAQVSSCFESECLDIDFDESDILGEPTPAKASRSAPTELHMGFDKAAVQSFPHDRFELVRKIEDASRNFGTVCLMRDLTQGTLVAMSRCQTPGSRGRTKHLIVLTHTRPSSHGTTLAAMRSSTVLVILIACSCWASSGTRR
jgi:hypothetical protein